MKYFHLHEVVPYVDCALLDQNTIKSNPHYKFIGFTLENNPSDVATQLYNSSIVYIHPDAYDQWINILDVLNEKKPINIKTIIISGSDYFLDNEVLDPLLEILPNTQFIVQNWVGVHNRVELLPIGVNEDYLKPIIKERLCGISYASNNSPDREEFQKYLDTTECLQRYVIPRLPRGEYLEELSKCYFSVCTAGNGYDTLRFWESLMVKAIPHVEKNEFIEHRQLHYPDIQMVVLERWEELDVRLNELDEGVYNRMWKENDACLSEYWINKL